MAQQGPPQPPAALAAGGAAPGDRLGKLVSAAARRLAKAASWSDFITSEQGRSDLQEQLRDLPHPAAPLLSRLSKRGVPVVLTDEPWTTARRKRAMARGSHPSTRDHLAFLRDEFATMIDQKFWVILPYSAVEQLPSLRISPMGVVPQTDRRPRTIVDYSFSGINQATLPLSPSEAMQFGRALERMLQKIHFANRRYGPVYMIKVDISDGFYRLQLSPSGIPSLGVVFPTAVGEEPLVAFPLVLPMGWVSSPPFFCALTESAADMANMSLRTNRFYPLAHPLSPTADQPSDYRPVPRRPRPASLPVAQSTESAVQPSASGPRPIASRPVPLPVLGPRPHLVPPPPLRPGRTQPLQPFVPTSPLAYVDLYMDDFLGLAQGHPKRRQRVRDTILHAIDAVFRPNDNQDHGTARREPISISKLNKGDALWTTRKIMLGWVIDTVAETIELTERRANRLHSLLADLIQSRRVSVKKWQQSLGELRSMVLAIPGGRGLFSTLYTALGTPSAAKNRIRITRPIGDALVDLQVLTCDLGGRPTRIGELVDTLPVAYGTADACGVGMGGVWLSPDPAFSPVLWRSPFPPPTQQDLVTHTNRSGSITNSDLELAAQLAEQDILVQIRDCRESTITTFTDNIATRAWHRKGSRSTLGAAAYLLRLNALHQRFYRYRSNIHYIAGPANAMADDASRLWHLSDSALLTHFNTIYPQHKPWKLSQLRPEMHSALITALQCKRSNPESFLPAHNTVMPPGFDGASFVSSSISTPCSPMWPTPSLSSKSLPLATAQAKLHPVGSLPDLVPWKQPFARLARRWPAWGPQIHGTRHKAISNIASSSN
jgi:hypothetical protein